MNVHVVCISTVHSVIHLQVLYIQHRAALPSRGYGSSMLMLVSVESDSVAAKVPPYVTHLLV